MEQEKVDFFTAIHRTEELQHEFIEMLPNYEEQITCMFGSVFAMLTIMIEIEMDRNARGMEINGKTWSKFK